MEPYGICDRCEERFPVRKLLKNGGLKLCAECFEYIEREYPKLMAEEYNQEQQKCRGCE